MDAHGKLTKSARHKVTDRTILSRKGGQTQLYPWLDQRRGDSPRIYLCHVVQCKKKNSRHIHRKNQKTTTPPPRLPSALQCTAPPSQQHEPSLAGDSEPTRTAIRGRPRSSGGRATVGRPPPNGAAGGAPPSSVARRAGRARGRNSHDRRVRPDRRGAARAPRRPRSCPSPCGRAPSAVGEGRPRL